MAKWERVGGEKLGQVAGLAVTKSGSLLVFHRGNVVWGAGTFDENNKLRERKAVTRDPVLELNSDSGALIRSFGKGRFYVPHGIATDTQGNIWLTDVGLHQVLKMTANGVLIRAWGEAFVPGNDHAHFCKPAAVAVHSDGRAFIADGYCNNRIVVLGPDGTFATSFGSRSQNMMQPALGTFILPHDVTLHESVDHLHVADRQNARTQMLFTNGTAVKELKPPNNFATVYSTDYCIHDGMMFLLPGEPPRDGADIRVFAVSSATAKVAYSFSPTSAKLTRPHILRAARDCSSVFIGEIDGRGGVVWKLDIQRDSAPLETPAKTSQDSNTPAATPTRPPPSLPAQSETKSGQTTTGAGRRGGLGVMGTLAVVSLVGVLCCASLFLCLRCRGSRRSNRRAFNLNSVGGGLFPDSNGRSHKVPSDLSLPFFGSTSHPMSVLHLAKFQGQTITRCESTSTDLGILGFRDVFVSAQS